VHISYLVQSFPDIRRKKMIEIPSCHQSSQCTDKKDLNNWHRSHLQQFHKTHFPLMFLRWSTSFLCLILLLDYFFSFACPYINIIGNSEEHQWILRIQNQKSKMMKGDSNQWLTSVFKWGHSRLASLVSKTATDSGFWSSKYDKIIR